MAWHGAASARREERLRQGERTFTNEIDAESVKCE
jgi:hypothetical protein